MKMRSNIIFVVFFLLLSSCTPAEAITSTPVTVEDRSVYVETVDTFYNLSNDAQSKDDFYKPWDMLTNSTQCGARYKCEYSNFQEWWWQWKVAYKLYDCGSNLVIVEERRYPRTESAAAETTEPQYWKYELSFFDEAWMVSEIKLTQPPGSECLLVLDRSK